MTETAPSQRRVTTKRTPIARFAWRELRQGWRHFATFLACLVLGVAVITTIGTLSATIENALEGEAAALLGGDVEVVLRTHDFAPEHVAYLAEQGRVSRVTTLRGMLRVIAEDTASLAGDGNRDEIADTHSTGSSDTASGADEMTSVDERALATIGNDSSPLLVELKAVDAAYPLIGSMQLEGRGMDDHHIAVDRSLLDQLGIEVGTRVRIGQAALTIGAVLTREPDRVVQIFTFGPRVMMTHEALARTGLTQGYSLAENAYRIMLHDNTQVDSFEDTLKARFPDMPWRVKTGTDGNLSIERFVEQLTLFLTLAGLATFLIGGIGIGSAVHAYMAKKADTIAVIKILGASRRTIFCIYALIIGVLAVLGSLMGIGVSAAVTALSLPFVAAFFPVHAAVAMDGASALLAAWYGLLIAYLFSIPALVGALQVKPSLLFRQGIEMVRLSAARGVWLAGALLAALLLLTVYSTSRDTLFVSGFVGVAALSFVVFALAATLVKAGARRVRVRQPWLRLALGNLHRAGNTTATVILAIGVSLTLLIALTLTEANFRDKITRVAEAEAPTLFMIDIQPDQTTALREMLQGLEGARQVMMFPMVRGRIVELNDQPVNPEDVKEDVQWAIRGDRGLSYSAAPPENAHIVEGEWWPQDYRGEPLVSVDVRFLDGMNLALGDTITLDILGERLKATVASARAMDYTTFQLNFALMLSPGVIDDFPQTYLATVYLDADSKGKATAIRQIADRFPNVTTIHTTEAVERVQEILGHIATALKLTLLVSLVAGLLVLSSALSAMLGYRLYDTAVLKVLGARRSDILKAYTSEWMLLAVVTVCIAAAIGTFGAWLILQRFPGDNDFLFRPDVTLITTAICVGVIWLVGYAGNRQVFRLRPAGLLRNE